MLGNFASDKLRHKVSIYVLTTGRRGTRGTMALVLAINSLVVGIFVRQATINNAIR